MPTKQRRPAVDHGTRRGDRANPHRGDCTGTLCSTCGCCQHCETSDDAALCVGCPGCDDRRCDCPTAREVAAMR